MELALYTVTFFFKILLATCEFEFSLAYTEERMHYTAAVVEYQPEGSPWADTGSQVIAKNLRNYLSYIQNASRENADIIVFPEYGLTTLGIPRDRDAAKPFLLFVPNIGQNPCESNLGSQEIQELSCAAKYFKIYVVVNLGEIRPCDNSTLNCNSDNFNQYNTNVVFDRNGEIIAKYEKANLYFEDQFDKPEPIQLSTFSTDFGVTFGIFTCYDIIFFNPAVNMVETGIQNFIFPTAWVDELPFLMAIQAQASWAHGADANLLASGYHQPLGGQLGSGIYSGKEGALVYSFDSESGSTLLLAEVPISPKFTGNKNENKQTSKSNIAAYHSFLRENLQNYTTKVLDLELTRDVSCTENGFCCIAEYQIAKHSRDSVENYRLLAFNDSRTVAAETAEYKWQVCSIVRCVNETLSSCTENDIITSSLPNFQHVELTAVFDIKHETRFLPFFNALDVNFDLINPDLFEFEKNVDEHLMQISSNSIQNTEVKTLAIINKIFDTSAYDFLVQNHEKYPDSEFKQTPGIFYGLFGRMEKWQWISLILCAFGLFKEFRPSEPFVTEYLIEHKNFTKYTVVHVAYPIATYSYLATLPIIFLVTDFLRYKTIIVCEAIAFVLTYTLLLWGNGLTNLKIVEVLYGLACSTEVAYYTYIYAKVDREQYKKVTAYTHTALLIGNFVAAVFSQVLVSAKLINFHQLNYITLGSMWIALLISLFLPGVGKSIYFYRNIETELPTGIEEDEELKRSATNGFPNLTYAQRVTRAYSILWQDFKQAYSNPYVVKWSVWLAVASAAFVQVVSYVQPLYETIFPYTSGEIYNGAVDAVHTILSAIMALMVGHVTLPWSKWGEPLLFLTSLVQGVLLIIMSQTETISVAYVCYILFRTLYQVMITVASSEVAQGISSDSCGLIFGLNRFISLILQSSLTLVFVDKSGLALSERQQFLVYGTYYLVLALVFAIAGLFAFHRYRQITTEHHSSENLEIDGRRSLS